MPQLNVNTTSGIKKTTILLYAFAVLKHNA